MYTELFFDDYRLFGREGTHRVYGTPVLLSEYFDPLFSTDYFSPWVFMRGDSFIMLYMGTRRSDGKCALLAASSRDGVRFEPLYGPDGRNVVMPLMDAWEPITVIEDVNARAEEKYKLILTKVDRERMCAFAEVYASPDLLSWKLFLSEIPGWHCEPVGGAFYNTKRDCYTILHRPTWGNRSAGYCETRDFIHYSDYELCLHQDALDGALDELYGMSAFEYAGTVVGFPMMYTRNAPSRKTKYESGSIVPQLAYSWDGHHFLRSLRSPFLPDDGEGMSLSWLSQARALPNGDVLLYGAYTPEAHGEAFRSHQNGRIRVYRLRKDGFIALKTEYDATVVTREFLYRGGDICINLSAEHATMAVVDTCGEDAAQRVWGTDETAPGFDHVDCLPFSGDSTCWTPRFKQKTLDSLAGRILILEIKYRNGALYSVSGDMEPLGNTQSARFRKTGSL